ncbi:MAG: PAS domain S-box protein, partial [Alphaproteobacteria bacterium]|nr:PAS domain S-box protein [Alphaproteobacteria bacterium]
MIDSILQTAALAVAIASLVLHGRRLKAAGPGFAGVLAGLVGLTVAAALPLAHSAAGSPQGGAAGWIAAGALAIMAAGLAAWLPGLAARRDGAPASDGGGGEGREDPVLAEAQRLGRFGYWATDAQAGQVRMAPLAFELAGRPARAAISVEEMRSYIHPDDRERYFRLRQIAAERREPLVSEHRYLRPDGSTRWIRVEGNPRYAADGSFLGYVGFLQDVTARRDAEEALRASEARYRSISELLWGFTYVYRLAADGKWEREWISEESFRRITGYEWEGVRADLSFYHPDDRERARRDVDAAFSGEANQGEYRVLTRDGRTRWLSVRRRPEIDPATGRTIAMYGAAEDVTDRRESQEALRASEEQLRTLFTFSPVGIARNAMDGTFVEANPAMLRMVGYTEEELRAVRYWDLTPRKYEEQEAQQLELLRTTGRYGPYEKEYVAKDGRSVPVNLHGALVTGQDGRQYIWSMVEDIAGRKASADALRRSETRYRKISEMIWGYSFANAVGADGAMTCEWMTEGAFRRTTGYRWEEIGVGFDLYHPDDRERARRDVARTVAGEPAHGEYRITTKSGAIRWLSIRRSVDTDPATGRVTMLYGAAEDVSDRKASEDALRLSEARYRKISEMIWGYSYAYAVGADGSLSCEWMTEAAFRRLTGYRWEEIGVGFSLYHPDDQESARRDVARTIAGEATHGEYRIKCKDGSFRWLSVRRSIDIDPATGRVAMLYGAAEDITERKESQEALRRSEARFRGFAESASDWYWEQDADLRISYISASNEALSGMRPEEHYGKTRREVWPLDVSEEQMAAHEADLAARRPFRDFRFARVGRDGKKRFLVLSGQPVFDPEGRFAGYRGIGRDITALVELERRAQEADARFIQAVEALDDGIVLTDPEDRIVYGNRNWRRLNAESAEHVQPGRPFIDHLRQRIAHGLIPEAAGDPEGWLRQRIANRRNPAGTQNIRLRSNGTWLLVKDQRLPDGSTITVLVDITEQKRREIA